MKYVRATVRAAIAITAIPVFVTLAAVQGFVVGPLIKNYTLIPNMLYNSLRALLGYKIEFKDAFNAAATPPAKGRQTWFVANHVSVADFIVLGSKLDGTFAGKGDILKWPGAAQIARAAKYIGLRRSAEFNAQSRAKIVKNFNEGYNTIMFPEGTTTDGKKVGLFRAALPSLLYGEKAVDKENKEVALQKTVIVQPAAIRVLEVEGKNALGNDELRNLYSAPGEENMLRMAWKWMQIKNMKIEVTLLQPLDPKDFKDAKDLMNKAALDIAAIVNPGQITFEKAAIPGQAQKPVTP